MVKMLNTKTRLKSPSPAIKRYASELEKENKKLHAQISKLQVKNISCEHRVEALEKELKKNAKNAQAKFASELMRVASMSEEQMEQQTIDALRAKGYRVEKP